MKKVLFLIPALCAVMMSFVWACSGEEEDSHKDATTVSEAKEMKGVTTISSVSREAKVVFYNTSDDNMGLTLSADTSSFCNFDFSDISVTIKDDTSYISALSSSMEKLTGYFSDNNLYLEITGPNLQDTLYFSTVVPADSLKVD